MTTTLYSNPNLLSAKPEFPDPFGYRDLEEGAPPRTVTKFVAKTVTSNAHSSSCRLHFQLVEYRMCSLSATLRNKPQWWVKFKDEAIVAKWRMEAIDQGLDTKQVNYVLAEMEDYARMRDEKSGAEVRGDIHSLRQFFNQF